MLKINSSDTYSLDGLTPTVLT